MEIRTVNLMHTARLTSPLDLERWCSNSSLHGISILLVISCCTSPAGQTSGVDVQCKHTSGSLLDSVAQQEDSLYIYNESELRAHVRSQVPQLANTEDTHPMHVYFCTLVWQTHNLTQGQSYAKALRCRIHGDSTRDQVHSTHTTSQRQAGERRRWNFSEKLRIYAADDAWFTHKHNPDTRGNKPLKLIIQSKLTSKVTPNRIGQVLNHSSERTLEVHTSTGTETSLN